MKVKILLIVLIIISGFVFCGKSNKKKIVIRYSGPSFQLYDQIRSDLGKGFEKLYPHVRTVYEPIPASGYFEKLQTQFAGKTEPDIFFMRDFELPIFVEKQVIMPLNEFIDKDKSFDLADYHEILIKSYSMNNILYGLPGSFTTGIIYYNSDILNQAGLKPVHDLSWNKLIKISQALTEKDSRRVVQQFGIVLEYYDWMTFILQNNGRIFSRDKKKCIINSPRAVEAIEFLKSLYKKYHIMPDNVDLERSESWQLFNLGRAALFTGGRWYTTTFNQITKFKWGIMPFFYHKKHATRLDSHSWVISSRTKYPDIAWKFLKYLTSQEGNWKMVEAGDSVPVHKSHISRFIKMNPENRVFIDSLKYAYTVEEIMSPYLSWREMMAIFSQEIDKYKIDQVSAEQVLKTIEERFNKAIQEHLSKKQNPSG